jgi:phosphoenolpyruvate synthase/pyruvate phosphate dikinase
MTTQSNFPLPADFQGFVLWDKMHCPIVSREYGMPCVVGTLIGTNALKDGMTVTVDGSQGVVRIDKR